MPECMCETEIRKYGGPICCICKHFIDSLPDSDSEAEGKGIAEDIRARAKKVRKSTKKIAEKAAKYVSSTDGLASDIVNYGIPAATSTLLGAPAAALGGPVAGVAASAVGSKLGTLAADKIAKETVLKDRLGQGMRKSRFEKGSAEAKEWSMRMRAAKAAKKQS